MAFKIKLMRLRHANHFNIEYAVDYSVLKH